MKKENQELEIQNQELKKEIRDLKEENSMFKDKNPKIYRKHNEVKDENQELKNQIRYITEENSILKSMIAKSNHCQVRLRKHVQQAVVKPNKKKPKREVRRAAWEKFRKEGGETSWPDWNKQKHCKLSLKSICHDTS